MAACRILVVDDDEDTRDSLCKLLELNGHRVDAAADGETALRLAVASDPDIVFLDIGLPQVDGFEVAEQLRRTAQCGNAFIVALSGYGEEKYLDRARRGGFDAYVVKPADVDELLRLIDRVRSEPGTASPRRERE